jgi:hypothetical protein
MYLVNSGVMRLTPSTQGVGSPWPGARGIRASAHCLCLFKGKGKGKGKGFTHTLTYMYMDNMPGPRQRSTPHCPFPAWEWTAGLPRTPPSRAPACAVDQSTVQWDLNCHFKCRCANMSCLYVYVFVCVRRHIATHTQHTALGQSRHT